MHRLVAAIWVLQAPVVSFRHSIPKIVIFHHAGQAFHELGIDPRRSGWADGRTEQLVGCAEFERSERGAARNSGRHERLSDMSAAQTSPPTRWEQQVVGDKWDFYAGRFDKMVADGTDLEGEARLVDALAPRGAAVLDGGCGTGRITAALQRMGHRAIGVDKDAGLIDIAKRRYPGVPYLNHDLLLLDSDVLTAVGAPAEFDIIVLPGNVMVYLAPGTEREVLRVLTGLLKPAGRLIAGFATDRDYSPASFLADADALDLQVEHQFGTWDLRPFENASDWTVTVLRRPDPDGQEQAPAATRWTPASQWHSDPEQHL